jgi:hypothetical protein
MLDESSEEAVQTCERADKEEAKINNRDGEEADGVGFMGTPCVNLRSDDDDDDEIQWTNDLLHGSAALPLAGLVNLSEQDKDE